MLALLPVNLDNLDLILPFAPERDDGDTFIYTEMLDRGKRKGNNGMRLVKTFYHRSKEELIEQMPAIRALCDLALVRACTRLAPRSWHKVGREFTRLVVETALTENWVGMKTLYNRALGIVTPNQKMWLWDVDRISNESNAFAKWLQDHANPKDGTGHASLLLARIPSKKGEHLISRPFDVSRLLLPAPAGIDSVGPPDVSLHKDNPTNLYIPDEAA